MSIIERESPGIYSDFDNSRVIWPSKEKTKVGIVVAIQADIGTVYNIELASQANSSFGVDSLATNLCKSVLQNGASQIVLVSAGSLGSDYESAFNVLKNQDDIGVIICDSELLSVHNLLMGSVLDSSQNMRERIGIIACFKDEPDKENWARSFNSERIILVAQNPILDSENAVSGCILAAALAGVISKMEKPSDSLNGKPLKGITKLDSNLSVNEIDNYISFGITPFEVVADKVKIVRAITSKITNNGALDKTYKEINTILVTDEIIKTIRNLLKSNFIGAKNTNNTMEAISSQVSLKMQEFLNSKIIDEYALPDVSFEESNPNNYIVNLDFFVSKVLNQIHITANILV